MSAALVPSPPKLRRDLAVVKGFVVNPESVRGLVREEVASRRDLVDREQAQRSDVEFLIAVARSEYRHQKGSHAKISDRDLFPQQPNVRHVHNVPDRRPELVHLRKPPTWMTKLTIEESELRNWVDRVEQKLRESLYAEIERELAFVTRLTRCEVQEDTLRRQMDLESSTALRSILRTEFMERPPLATALRPQRQLLADEEEELAREQLLDEELDERRQIHDWLVLRYGVLIFSLNRIEDIYRQELQEQEVTDRVSQFFEFFHTKYRSSMLTLAAFHASRASNALLIGTALV